MHDYSPDIFTENEDIDVDTLANLGPLRALAGVWEGTKGFDVNPFEPEPRRQVYVERIDLQPTDPQSNGPQFFYGLRYHTHIVKPGEVETYHDQVGYWLWEPATGMIVHTLTIPRGQIVLATGQAAADATRFEVTATRGSTVNGICSQPFLEQAFRTDSFRMEALQPHRSQHPDPRRPAHTQSPGPGRGGRDDPGVGYLPFLGGSRKLRAAVAAGFGLSALGLRISRLLFF
jgi:hypothetical protein